MLSEKWGRKDILPTVARVLIKNGGAGESGSSVATQILSLDPDRPIRLR